MISQIPHARRILLLDACGLEWSRPRWRLQAFLACQRHFCAEEALELSWGRAGSGACLCWIRRAEILDYYREGFL